MSENKLNLEKTVGEMQKSPEKMADGERYIIFYTFNEIEITEKNEVREDV